MRTNSVIIIGIAILFVIFGISSYLQWECAQEIKKVSEYHERMSIPAVSLLNEIKLDFQSIHIISIENIESVQPNTRVEEGHISFQQSIDDFTDNVEKYDSLSYTKNSQNELLADEMMINQMKNYSHVYREIINSNDMVLEKFENGEVSRINAILELQSIETEFHKTIEENIKMEIMGMKKTQAKIGEIERQMEIIFFSSSIVAVISTILILIFATRFVTIPISKLVEATKEISKGKTINVEKESANSDANNVMVALDSMSKELEKYRINLIKQEKLSSIGELASRLAHDIRNPLTVIKVTFDVIKAKNKNLTPEDLEKFERVDNAMYRITHQIDNVLDFIKGKPLKFEKHKINDIVNSVIEDLPKSEQITLEIVCEDSEIECDFEAMKVALINLLINSIQAIEGHGKIKISSKIRGDDAIIEIEDSGPGIPKEILEKIFEPLYTTKEEGTGLGLVSCKSLIEQHHGKISVQNNPTRFIIEIPRKFKQKTE